MNFLLQYALSFLGTPYRWGGENPISGVDCSGFVQEVLRSVGMDPPGDQTAQSLYNHFESRATPNVYQAGSLAFYGKSVREIIHVAFLIDPYRVIEAGGGGSKTLTKDDADQANAFVRIRPIKHRLDFRMTLKPQYVTIGLI